MRCKILQPYSHTAIQPYSHTAIQPYSHTAIQPYSHTAIQPYSQLNACTKFKQLATKWHDKMRRRYRTAKEGSNWWIFIPRWDADIDHWLADFCAGNHRFSPMTKYKFSDGAAIVWEHLDRLIMHLIYLLIKPTFKHIISPLCSHLKGPSVIKGLTAQIKAALATQQFNYVMRVDIKSYYASINHRILLQQINNNFDDPGLTH